LTGKKIHGIIQKVKSFLIFFEGDPLILTGQIIFPTLVGVASLAKTAIDSTCSKQRFAIAVK
jgi:hypothetical protein